MKTVLVLNGEGIGNLIQATPLLKALSSLGYKVTYLLDPNSPEAPTVFGGLSFVWRVGTYQKDPGLLDTQYDLAVVIHWFRPKIQVNAKNVIRLDKPDYANVNESSYFFGPALALGFTGDMPTTEVATSGRDFGFTQQPVLGLHPGAPIRWPFKKKAWPYFREFASLVLLKSHIKTVLVVGGKDDNTPITGWPNGTINLSGSLSLADTAAALSQCSLFVGTDSGITHMAAALNIPTYAIYGPTAEKKNAPVRNNYHTVAVKASCRPCHNYTGLWLSCTDAECMTWLRPEAVFGHVFNAEEITITIDRGMTDAKKHSNLASNAYSCTRGEALMRMKLRRRKQGH